MLTALSVLTKVPGLGGWVPVHATHAGTVVPAAPVGAANDDPAVKNNNATKDIGLRRAVVVLCMLAILLVSEGRDAQPVKRRLGPTTTTIEKPPARRKG
ncbi:MAG: hypothetical protein ABSE47_17025 [Acidimicrobiales bacterium]